MLGKFTRRLAGKVIGTLPLAITWLRSGLLYSSMLSAAIRVMEYWRPVCEYFSPVGGRRSRTNDHNAVAHFASDASSSKTLCRESIPGTGSYPGLHSTAFWRNVLHWLAFCRIVNPLADVHCIRGPRSAVVVAEVSSLTPYSPCSAAAARAPTDGRFRDVFTA